MDNDHFWFADAVKRIKIDTFLDAETVRHCLECAIAEAASEFFRCRGGFDDIEIDLDARTSYITFQVGSQIGPDEIEWLLRVEPIYMDVIEVPIHLNGYDKDDFYRTLSHFTRNIREVEADVLEKRWRPKVRTAVEGVIKEKSENIIEINLGDEVNAIMPKREWTPLEAASYREGKLFDFYVVKVLRNKAAVTVVLSRGNPNLPAAIIKTAAPWADIKTLRRLRGRKTWLKIRPTVPRSVLADVSRRLNGEVIETL